MSYKDYIEVLKAQPTMKGQLGLILQAILAIILVPIFIMVGLLTFGNFEGSVDHSTISASASTEINDTATQAYNGFGFSTVIIIVVVAGAIITILIVSLARVGVLGR